MKIILTIFLSVLVCFNTFSLRKSETEGAFIQTCRNVVVNQNILSAQCKNMNQQFIATTLDLNQCIANINGNLQQAVNGNFGLSSNSCRISGQNLICTANTNSQTPNHNANINLDSFITNLDGNLSCDNNPRRVTANPAPMRTPAPVAQPTYADHIESTGNVLRQNSQLRSKNNKSFLIMQTDGNLVLYSNAQNNRRKANFPTWASNTGGLGKGPYRAVLSDNGNLSVFDSTNRSLWSTNSNGKGVGPYSIVVQNDGNFVLYDSKGIPIWASQTFMKYK